MEEKEDQGSTPMCWDEGDGMTLMEAIQSRIVVQKSGTCRLTVAAITGGGGG
jgi:hypothetical protein